LDEEGTGPESSGEKGAKKGETEKETKKRYNTTGREDLLPAERKKRGGGGGEKKIRWGMTKNEGPRKKRADASPKSLIGKGFSALVEKSLEGGKRESLDINKRNRTGKHKRNQRENVWKKILDMGKGGGV